MQNGDVFHSTLHTSDVLMFTPTTRFLTILVLQAQRAWSSIVKTLPPVWLSTTMLTPPAQMILVWCLVTLNIKSRVNTTKLSFMHKETQFLYHSIFDNIFSITIAIHSTSWCHWLIVGSGFIYPLLCSGNALLDYLQFCSGHYSFRKLPFPMISRPELIIYT